jgi:hypothetical protein
MCREGHEKRVGTAFAMMTIKNIIPLNWMHYQVYLGLSIAVVGLTGLISLNEHRPFQRYIDGLNPTVAGLLVCILGGILLTILLSNGWFSICSTDNRFGLYLSCSIATVLGIIMILMDLKIVFPADTNVPLPASMLFYPAIGFFVEVLFHLLPLTLLMTVLTTVFKSAAHDHILWASLLLVALLEPAYQVLWMANRFPAWAAVYVGLHVFVINLIQLVIFKQYGFLSMYSFRLVYYLVWHIGWGYVRLKVLF